MRPAFYDNSIYRQKQAQITKRGWQAGIYEFRKKALEIRFRSWFILG